MSPEWDRFVTAVKLNKAGNGGAQNRVGNANAGQGKPIKCYNCNGLGHIARNCTQPKRPHNSDYFKDKMLLMQAQENGAVLDEEELLFLAGEHANTFDADVDNHPVQDLALNEDNIFQEDECDAFDSDVDDEPTDQSIFMANLSLAGPSNASTLSEIHILENDIDHSVTNQDRHEIHNEVQQANVIDSTSVDMGNSNGIPYEQYLSVNNVSVVPSSAWVVWDSGPVWLGLTTRKSPTGLRFDCLAPRGCVGLIRQPPEEGVRLADAENVRACLAV
ncbi:retrovirus-related pol polyprotein from transposon TNT 1-94 [Tanacetum coccineum]